VKRSIYHVPRKDEAVGFRSPNLSGKRARAWSRTSKTGERREKPIAADTKGTSGGDGRGRIELVLSIRDDYRSYSLLSLVT
jgi:hypothetical protein